MLIKNLNVCYNLGRLVLATLIEQCLFGFVACLSLHVMFDLAFLRHTKYSEPIVSAFSNCIVQAV